MPDVFMEITFDGIEVNTSHVKMLTKKIFLLQQQIRFHIYYYFVYYVKITNNTKQHNP